MGHHVARIARLGASVVIRGIWYHRITEAKASANSAAPPTMSRRFSRPVAPDSKVIRPALIPSHSARAATTASFARPPSGGAVTEIFSRADGQPGEDAASVAGPICTRRAPG